MLLERQAGGLVIVKDLELWRNRWKRVEAERFIIGATVKERQSLIPERLDLPQRCLAIEIH